MIEDRHEEWEKRGIIAVIIVATSGGYEWRISSGQLEVWVD
jgi:hypothetical protein